MPLRGSDCAGLSARAPSAAHARCKAAPVRCPVPHPPGPGLLPARRNYSCASDGALWRGVHVRGRAPAPSLASRWVEKTAWAQRQWQRQAHATPSSHPAEFAEPPRRPHLQITHIFEPFLSWTAPAWTSRTQDTAARWQEVPLDMTLRNRPSPRPASRAAQRPHGAAARSALDDPVPSIYEGAAGRLRPVRGPHRGPARPPRGSLPGRGPRSSIRPITSAAQQAPPSGRRAACRATERCRRRPGPDGHDGALGASRRARCPPLRGRDGGSVAAMQAPRRV